MKKTIAVVLILMIAFGLTACSKKTAEEILQENITEAIQDKAETEAYLSEGPDRDKILNMEWSAYDAGEKDTYKVVGRFHYGSSATRRFEAMVRVDDTGEAHCFRLRMLD